MISMSLQDMVNEIVQTAQRQAEIDLNDGFDKTAGVQGDTDLVGDLTYDDIEKVASAIETFLDTAETVGHGPRSDQRKLLGLFGVKTAAKTPGQGHLRTCESEDGKHNYESTGQATSQAQPKSSKLKGRAGAKAATGIHNEPVTDKGIQQPTLTPGFPGQHKAAHAQTALAQRVLAKFSGVEGRKGGLNTYATGEGPSAGGPESRLFGRVDGKTSFTKQQAKSFVKKELRQLLDEPAMSKKTDPVLHNAWRNTSKAGVKIAGAQTQNAVIARFVDVAEMEG